MRSCRSMTSSTVKKRVTWLRGGRDPLSSERSRSERRSLPHRRRRSSDGRGVEARPHPRLLCRSKSRAWCHAGRRAATARLVRALCEHPATARRDGYVRRALRIRGDRRTRVQSRGSRESRPSASPWRTTNRSGSLGRRSEPPGPSARPRSPPRSEKSAYAAEVRANIVTATGNVVNSSDTIVLLDDSIGMNELFNGASATGSAAFVIPDGESALIRVRPARTNSLRN